MGEVIRSFPLFPLGIVLLPEEVVPLHIFEERYKTMIGECLDEEREFGIVWLAQGGLRDVGCTAEIARLLERMEDGRMNILVRGRTPFRLLRRVDDLVYPAGDIELLEDAPGDRSEPTVADEARERYADLVERLTDSRPDPAALAELGSYGMAATIDFAPELKQSLLEARSEEQRLAMVAELFTSTLRRLELVERTSEQARSNGRLRPGGPT
ncbi:MAG: LON peptidase substrate-binding domain-containing protein [Thermoleophilaceae bacterium]|nr:LON peptidase substrate-binding domain-containing protein [Thermoleophilaceae bacterium]